MTQRSYLVASARVTAGALSLMLLQAVIGTAVATGAGFPIAVTGQPEMCVNLAFDGTNYLAGIEGDAGAHDAICAQLLSQSGSLVGSLIPTGRRGGVPSLAWDGVNYLLIWQDCGDPCLDELYGAFISPAGVAGTPFLISGTFQEIGGLAFGATDYLAVYFKEVNPPTEDSKVYGRLVSTGGTAGSEIVISSGNGDFGLNNVAFDGTNFLVVWVEESNGFEIRGRFVDTAGIPGTEISINASAALSDNPVTVVFHGGQYLAVWSDEVTPAEWDLFGQRLDTAGNKIGAVIPISTASLGQFGPFIGPGTNGFLVTWTDLRNDLNGDLVCDPGEGTCLDIYGQFVTPSGALAGSEVPLVTDAGNQWVSPVARGSSDFLMAWIDGGQPFDVGGDVYGQLVADRFIFVDDFESGDTSAWGSSVP